MADSPILYENTLRKLDISEQVKSLVRDKLQSNRLAGFDVPQKRHNHPDCDSDKIPFEVRLNTNGYVGVHLIISPLPYDDYYKNEPLLFDKFELQIRSLIHEAWSEIQPLLRRYGFGSGVWGVMPTSIPVLVLQESYPMAVIHLL